MSVDEKNIFTKQTKNCVKLKLKLKLIESQLFLNICVQKKEKLANNKLN
jgi:hypothetical protein